MWIRFNRSKAEKTDSELIGEYQGAGDIEAVGLLFDRYLEMIYGVCLKYLKHEEKSKDATISIFEILVKKLKTHDVKSFKSWLYVLTKNHCLEILRKEKAHPVVDFDSGNMHSLEILHHDIEFEFLDDYHELYDCMAKLSDAQKEVVRLFYFEKRSYVEIAEMMDITREKVRSNIQNGRRNLKLCLEKKHAIQTRSK